MEYTQNYQLPLWDKEDAIKRTDFNDNNSKVDAALGTLAQASAGHGNCKIVCGSYIGTGTYDTGNPNTLTFDHKPMLVRNSTFVYTYAEYPNSQCTVSWGDSSVSWYGSSSAYQFNKSSTTYYYVALLAADE